jgi:SRSO17 transposase
MQIQKNTQPNVSKFDEFMTSKTQEIWRPNIKNLKIGRNYLKRYTLCKNDRESN